MFILRFLSVTFRNLALVTTVDLGPPSLKSIPNLCCVFDGSYSFFSHFAGEFLHLMRMGSNDDSFACWFVVFAFGDSAPITLKTVENVFDGGPNMLAYESDGRY